MTTSPPPGTAHASGTGVPTFTVSVAGGELLVHDYSGPAADPKATPIVLVHGITANGQSWRAVGRDLAAGVAAAHPIWAPDLRGRAGSRLLSGPYGLDAHVADLVALADAAGAERILLVGHSMGGFVAALAAVSVPERLAGVVLVDGGPALVAGGEIDIDAALAAVLGPAMARLSMRFDSPAAYLDFWRAHPAVGPALDGPHGPDVADFLLADLVPAGPAGAADTSDEVGAAGGWVSSCVLEAIRDDGRGVLIDERAHGGAARAAQAGIPTEFVWAHRGMLDEDQGLYDGARIAAMELPPQIRITGVPGVNHYTVLFTPAGVAAVGAAVSRLLPAP